LIFSGQFADETQETPIGLPLETFLGVQVLWILVRDIAWLLSNFAAFVDLHKDIPLLP
jgi:hypothetical protein